MAVPVFHSYGHKADCQVYYYLNLHCHVNIIIHSSHIAPGTKKVLVYQMVKFLRDYGPSYVLSVE